MLKKTFFPFVWMAAGLGLTAAAAQAGTFVLDLSAGQAAFFAEGLLAIVLYTGLLVRFARWQVSAETRMYGSFGSGRRFLWECCCYSPAGSWSPMQADRSLLRTCSSPPSFVCSGSQREAISCLQRRDGPCGDFLSPGVLCGLWDGCA